MDPELAAVRDHAARSWPASEAVEHGGWLLRSTPAVPRGRLNSALPLRPDPDLEPVLAFYAERGQPAQAQVTPLEGHPRLTARLDAESWGARWPTVVLRAPIPALLGAPVPAAAATDAAIELLARPEPRWLAAWASCEGRDPASVAAHADVVLARLAGRAAYALAPEPRAVGLAVCDAGRCGLFAIAVDPGHRRAGLGSRVVRALVAWAHERGGREAYLEVEERNAPALALYDRLGFARAYGYVHRTAPAAGVSA